MLVLAMEFSRSAPHRQPEIRAGGAQLASGRTDTSDVAVGTTTFQRGPLPQNGIVRSDALAGPGIGADRPCAPRRDSLGGPGCRRGTRTSISQ